jgi:SAM-dependent MidA family methyltransferase
MTPDTGNSPSPLLDEIRREIRRLGPISFSRFMELALYDPEHGYYARGAERLGTRGDFFTASDSGRGFGRCVARQVQEIDRLAGSPDPFHVVEFGAGRGLLARDVVEAVDRLDPGLAGRLRYVMVDRSAGMRAAAAANVPRARAVAPGELQSGLRGCVLAVELFDALPVRRLRRRSGKLYEIRVGLDEAERLMECETAPAAAIEALAARYGAAAEDGTEAELAPALAAELEAMQAVLDHGVLILVDYGFPAAELYDPSRGRGTLLAYHRHATNEQFFERVGEQDLTAHVNFTALEDCAREMGLDVLGLTTQDRFLVANGILEYFEQEQEEQAYDPLRVKERMQAMQLIHPLGMGRTFKVLMLSKGWQPPPELDGLSDPFGNR